MDIYMLPDHELEVAAMQDNLLDFLRVAPQQLTALVLSGAAGAYVRAVFTPEASWRKRITEGVAGALSAIFLGGVVGHVIDQTTGAGAWSYLAAGFIMGEGGIAAVRGVRARLLPGKGK